MSEQSLIFKFRTQTVHRVAQKSKSHPRQWVDTFVTTYMAITFC